MVKEYSVQVTYVQASIQADNENECNIKYNDGGKI